MRVRAFAFLLLTAGFDHSSRSPYAYIAVGPDTARLRLAAATSHSSEPLGKRAGHLGIMAGPACVATQ
jgi:hypothetical protein